jgi:hypothetical protein
MRRIAQPNGDFALNASMLLARVAATLGGWTLKDVAFALLAMPLTLFVITALDVLHTESLERRENGAIGDSTA